MACSCKKRNVTNEQIQVQANIISEHQPTIQKQSYDFSVSTKPLQTCPYCASKHLALALALLNKKNIKESLIALGQLMAALYHYNIQQTAQVHRIQDIIQDLFQSKFEVTKQLLDNLSLIASQAMYIKILQSSKQQITSATQYSPKEALKHAALAYSLLFTQLFYQQINKPYAIGQLVLAALHLQQKDRDRARKLRQIWKIVQQIQQPNDQDYLKSRQLLINFLIELYQALIIIV